MADKSTSNQVDTPYPQKKEDYKINIQMNKINDKYIEINITMN